MPRVLSPSGRSIGLGIVLLVMGALHFLVPAPFDTIIPRVFPESTRRPLTYASGAAEVATGALLVNPSTRRAGGFAAFWLLLAVWPANIDAALRGGYPGLPGFAGSALAAWLRVPLQLPLLWLAHRIHRDPR